MKLLWGECIDRRLAKDLKGHDVRTVPQMGWAGVMNGELLMLAEKQFNVFITVDRNLSFQQNLPTFNIAVLVLHAASNRLADLKLLTPKTLSTLPTLIKGKAEEVSV